MNGFAPAVLSKTEIAEQIESSCNHQIIPRIHSAFCFIDSCGDGHCSSMQCERAVSHWVCIWLSPERNPESAGGVIR